ncbi:hypothetical protein DPMN_054545 [Dreissena polymorpha]|uniref:Uncharacterized protein n=1 Tax=Dreissena polymorpha TaxID=45954 RepID=A0A9D4CQ29_DREPO|nr:hypothetical protein DPMN_054545 [Dreissena polymorpha]
MDYSLTSILRTVEVESSGTSVNDDNTGMEVNQHHIHETEIEVTNKYKRNMVGIVMQCVQPSLAMVKDREHFAQRETKRVDIILNALGNIDATNNGISNFAQSKFNEFVSF